MYDPKFEKGVRQKMEGLEFVPSESVWANIEKAVAGRHHHRRGFYLWRFVFPGLLLAGAVSVGYVVSKPVANPSNPPAAATSATPPAATSASAMPVSTPPASVAAAPVSASLENSAAATDHATARDQAASLKLLSTHKHTTDQGQTLVHHPAAAQNRNFSSAHFHSGANRKNSTSKDPQLADDDRESADNASSAGSAPSAGNSRTTINTPAATASAVISPYLYQPPLAGQGSASAVKAAKPTKATKTISLGKLKKAERPWEAGFTASGGISRLNHLNLSASSNYNNQPLSTNYYNLATTANNAAAAPSKQYVSDIRPDASFTAGIYLQKPLTSRWTLNLGMGLHYYSTRITIGQAVNTYVPAAASLITPTALTGSQQSATAFIAGDQQVFTNHYYFLELPVNMQYQLNKSHLLPIFLQGGLSLSRLMGSDALFYNTHSGVYYKDPGVLEKTQFNASSALMVGLPFHGIKIQLGPEIEYGLTPLINNSNQGDQHFLYTGIRVVIIPGKK